jgi:AcrR family transcriptional regulator
MTVAAGVRKRPRLNFVSVREGPRVTKPRPRPTGRPIASDGEKTRAAILEVARRMFAEQGYESTSLDSIARAIGLTRTAVYHYFPSKRDIAQAIFTDEPPDALSWWVDAAHTETTIAAKLRAIFARLVARASEDWTGTQVYMSLVRSGQVDAGVHSTIRGHVTELEEHIGRLVDEASANGELSGSLDRTSLIEAILGMIWALVAGIAEAPDERVQTQVVLAGSLLLNSGAWLKGGSDELDGRPTQINGGGS